jgi:hypothetical protein
LSIGSGHDFPGSRIGENQMLDTQRLHRNVERHAGRQSREELVISVVVWICFRWFNVACTCTSAAIAVRIYACEWVMSLFLDFNDTSCIRVAGSDTFREHVAEIRF